MCLWTSEYMIKVNITIRVWFIHASLFFTDLNEISHEKYMYFMSNASKMSVFLLQEHTDHLSLQ